jgi:hypothetical protein
MAHFAELDENDVVLRVIVVNNSDLSDGNGGESEAIGISFCQSLFGVDTRWVQTSYNGNFRVRYAGLGFTYDLVRNAFIPPQPYPSWVIDETTINWTAPVPYPDDGLYYVWDEPSLSWVLASGG